MSFSTTVFVLGVIGGALAELLRWYQLRESLNLPEYAKNPVYWIITALMILAGGVLAVVHGIDAAKPLLALNIGISAPLVLKGLAAAAPSQTTTVPPKPSSLEGAQGIRSVPESKPEPSVRNFIAGR